MDKKMSLLVKIAAGVAVGSAGILTWLAIRKSQDEKRAASTASTGIDSANLAPNPIYSLAPGLGVDVAALPILRPGSSGTAGSTYWVFGDDTAPEIAMYLTNKLIQMSYGAQQIAEASGSTSSTFLSDFGAQVTNQGTAGLPAADVWIGLLSKAQEDMPIGALVQSVQEIKKALPNQRILWVLTPMAPASLAQALSVAGAEWFRSANDATPDLVNDIGAVLTAQSPSDLAAAFPPPAGALA